MASETMIRVLAVDDHPLMMGGIAGEIKPERDMRVVAQANDAAEGIALFRTYKPDVTLMDIRMPNVDGLDAVSAIRAEFPQARIVVLTTVGGDVQALRAFKAGAVGYLLKNSLRKDLVDTIRWVHAGQKRIPPEIAKELAEHFMDKMSVGYVDAGNRITQTSDGKIWFAGPELQMIDPTTPDLKQGNPPVHIEQVVIDRRSYDSITPRPASSIRVPSSSGIGSRGMMTLGRMPALGRQAFYNDLSPGRYRFEVLTAADEDEHSQAHGDSLAFTITPAFYQTWWFRTLGVAVAVLALWGLFMVRLARVTGLLRLRQRERLTERENIARDLHDTFFQAPQSLFLRIRSAAKQLPARGRRGH